MKGLKSALFSWKGIVALSLGGFVFASCSHDDVDGVSSLDEYQSQVYNKAFAEQFGTPAADHDWGFGSMAMASASIYTDSYEFLNSAFTRATAPSVTSVNSVSYNTFNDVMKNETATCYFYLKIDNRIILQEQNVVMSNPSADFFPKDIKLNDNVQDYLFSTDNEGEIYTKVLDSLANVRDGGVSIATSSDSIPEILFKKAPSFETMALHVPDANKIKIAGSIDKFNKDYKIFWYVAKWQGNGDKKIHVDGVVVPKDQITINVPEYKKRIIVEDLKGNIAENTQVQSSDFDFNDVVFDAVVWSVFNKDAKQNETHLKVIVRAAGGQMPILVANKEIHQGTVKYMFNTSNPNYNFRYDLIKDSIIARVPANGPDETFNFDFNTIPVVVMVDGKPVTAGANIGEAPEKIAVGLDYKWCTEKKSILDAYDGFKEYVKNKTKKDWYKK